MDKILMPAELIPGFRVQRAFQNGTEKKFLITTWGGLGDQVCAEPTLRYALETFNECEISLCSQHPELFSHLNFKEVIPWAEINKVKDKYLVFDTIVPPSHILWQFLSHCVSHCVDFASICAFRSQLPVASREVHLPSFSLPEETTKDIEWKNAVIIHPGRHWRSKTFPKAWWDRTIAAIQSRGFQPVIIGKETDDNRGTVDVHIGEGVLDLREKLSLIDLVAVLKSARYVLSNDSSPIHIAAAGSAHIFFIASCKHPDYITHWRNGHWGWRMKNLGLDGIWNYVNHNPSVENEVSVEKLPDGVMEKLLPEPCSVAEEIANVASH